MKLLLGIKFWEPNFSPPYSTVVPCQDHIAWPSSMPGESSLLFWAHEAGFSWLLCLSKCAAFSMESSLIYKYFHERKQTENGSTAAKPLLLSLTMLPECLGKALAMADKKERLLGAWLLLQGSWTCSVSYDGTVTITMKSVILLWHLRNVKYPYSRTPPLRALGDSS